MSNIDCCICSHTVDSEKADILAMGGYGIPRYLCEECVNELNTVTRGTDIVAINAAMDRLGEKMSDTGVEDRLVISTMKQIFTSSAARARAIEDGTYDFALDDAADDDSFDEIPPELEESEEDKLLDEKDEIASKRLDKVINWMSLIVLAGVIGYLIYYYLL